MMIDKQLQNLSLAVIFIFSEYTIDYLSDSD